MVAIAGEDRSSYQAVTSWSGDVFGIAKACEGLNYSDPTFSANWRNLQAEGKPRGAYHFFHPAQSATGQAQTFISSVKSRGGIEPGDFFVLDAEITVGARGLEEYGTARAMSRMHTGLLAAGAPGMTASAVGAAALECLNEIAALVGPQHKVALYTDLYMAQNVLGNCSSYPLFIAAYQSSAPSVAPWKSWTFWQSRAGGGPGGGDLDHFNGDEAALKAWAGTALRPLPANWVYQPVRSLTARPGRTSVALEWDSPSIEAGYQPPPAIAEYQVAVTLGPKLEGPNITSYPRIVPKGANPETWQGGSLQRHTQYTAGVRASLGDGSHAGEWATVTFSTT